MICRGYLIFRGGAIVQHHEREAGGAACAVHGPWRRRLGRRHAGAPIGRQHQRRWVGQGHRRRRVAAHGPCADVRRHLGARRNAQVVVAAAPRVVDARIELRRPRAAAGGAHPAALLALFLSDAHSGCVGACFGVGWIIMHMYTVFRSARARLPLRKCTRRRALYGRLGVTLAIREAK